MTPSPNPYPANDDETQLTGFIPPMRRNLTPAPANDGETQLTGFIPPTRRNLTPAPANGDETQLTGFIPPTRRNLTPAPANGDETQLTGFVPPTRRNLTPAPANGDETQLAGFVPPTRRNLTPAPTNDEYRAPAKQTAVPPRQNKKQPTTQKEEKKGSASLVGWLVITAGRHSGETLELQDGDNFITYSDSKGLQHTAAPTESCNLVISYSPSGYYATIPEKPNTQPDWGIELKAGASLRLRSGVTLRFVPLCNGNFSWK